ncbi:carboxypeptidase-like regulatory domain-containing protein [Pontibacter sp. G13]|uniref:carboxypeptidase-like regulatory domain-containing protein n=1 Tax=Pontibacter sp. G13 TaxID=3074898 RepID=UPI0028893235|nr:carboxypeptidase-like regulatory domain-containing protein [Pontibacter sp. G13]WNJ18797.1 carboxypeptidase-like regulatory domain-containing protein [Pontibacter sp. G13]
MHKRFNLSRLQSCHQVWDEMPTCDQGRICQTCDKVIHDFRGKSDWDIALAHAKTSEPVCGIYDRRRLDHDKRLSSVSLLPRKWWMAGILGLLTADPLTAQERVAPPPITQIQGASSDSQSTIDQLKDSALSPQVQMCWIEGIVKDFEAYPVVGAAVILKGANLGTFTDTAGAFTLSIPDSLLKKDSHTFIFQAIGYPQKTITLNASDFSNLGFTGWEIVLEPPQLIEFGVERAPWHKRMFWRVRNWFRRKDR